MRVRHSAQTMGGNDDKAAREARLAAKLRENLRRRKAQSRARDAEPSSSLPKPEDEG